MRLCALLCFGLLSPAAHACSFAFEGLPYDAGHYVFYARVLEHVSFRMEACGRDPRRTGDRCPPAWGWKLEVIEPVNLPAPVKQVEYYEYTVDAACGPLPLGEAHVQKAPAGSLVVLVARPPWSSAPKTALPRLTSALPINGLLAVLPAGADPAALARHDFDPRDVACLPEGRWPDGRLAFEYWRERQALDREESARGRLERLLRIMSVLDPHYFQRKESPTVYERVVQEYLPPDLLDEFHARLPAMSAAAHAACPKH